MIGVNPLVDLWIKRWAAVSENNAAFISSCTHISCDLDIAAERGDNENSGTSGQYLIRTSMHVECPFSAAKYNGVSPQTSPI
jgi:hypothetical protein